MGVNCTSNWLGDEGYGCELYIQLLGMRAMGVNCTSNWLGDEGHGCELYIQLAGR